MDIGTTLLSFSLLFDLPEFSINRRIGNTIQYKGIINMGTTWVSFLLCLFKRRLFLSLFWLTFFYKTKKIRDLEDTGTIKNLFQIVAEKKTYFFLFFFERKPLFFETHKKNHFIDIPSIHHHQK